MTGLRGRRALVRSAASLPWLAGGALVWLGLGGEAFWALPGSALLVTAGLLHFGALSGDASRPPGRLRIATRGRGETPVAFYVRARGRGLLFYRALDRARGGLADTYCVIALPPGCDERTLRIADFEPPEDSRLLGLVPARDLRFGRRGACVDAASLSAALRRLAPADAVSSGRAVR